MKKAVLLDTHILLWLGLALLTRDSKILGYGTSARLRD